MLYACRIPSSFIQQKRYHAILSAWLDSTELHSFNKRIFEVQKINDYIIEIGTYSKSFSRIHAARFSYEGKYLSIWRINNDTLTLVSEMWGANKQIPSSNFSFISMNVSGEIPKRVASNKVLQEVDERNKLITELVSKREGVRHANEIFAKDAIYMTYDEPMFVGMDEIKDYFTEHEKPGDVEIKRLDLKSSKVIDLDEFVIEYSYYNGQAAWQGGEGEFHGKSINIWKRNKNGKLMMYRQMVNH